MDLHDVIGLGVAGNFTGHLEQAGEASDFEGVAVRDASAPKGVFPFYAPGGGEHFRLASYLLRDGDLQAYGVDSAVTGYSYFHDRLLDWLVERINVQADEGPLESISGWLERAGRPERALVSISATRYTEFGEHHFLAAGDTSSVVAYDARRYDEKAIRELVLRDELSEAPDLSSLRQRVE